MFYDLQQEIKATFSNKLSDVSGMNVMESLTDTITSFNPINNCNRFLILATFLVVFAVITLLALKCFLASFHKTMRQHKREKAVFTVWLYNLTVTIA